MNPVYVGDSLFTVVMFILSMVCLLSWLIWGRD